MARNQATQVENNFVTGLITEKTALSFPENAVTATDNCIFKQQGNVTRRKGLIQETGYVPFSTSTATPGDQVYNTYLWEAVSGSGNISFLVSQQGSNIYFYDVSNSTEPSAHLKSFFIDLVSFLPVSSLQSPSLKMCDFASGNGDLIVVNPVCDPFYVTYDAATDSITTTKFKIKYRDFDGVTDEYADSLRPAVATLATLFSGSPNHSYNLYNQGWGQSDALSQWDAAAGILPSNQDQVAMFRLSETDSFDATKLTSKSPGNTLAPRGHFILEANNPQRAAVMAAEGVAGLGIIASDGQAQVSNLIGTPYSFGSKFNTRLANAFDNVTVQASGVGAQNSVATTTITIGKSYIGTPKIFTRMIIYAPSNVGIDNIRTITFKIYGKSGVAPATETDGTLLLTLVNPTAAGTIINLPFTNSTAYEYIWIQMSNGGFADFWSVAEVKIYEQTDTQQRFSTTAFLAGRAFYAGIDSPGESGKVYFSQIVRTKDQYGRCYQSNDPTNEYFFELLSDDGGVIKILEMGTVVRLFPMRSSMIIFASNGIWLISGSGGIKATDFNVKKISSLGTTSPQSIVDVKGTPVWWAEDGIYTMQYDANYDSYSAVSLSQTTIKKFFTDIPITNRKYVKGTYDVLNEIIYWVFNDGASLTASQYYKYNRILCLNLITKAFYPWSYDVSTKDIRGIKYIADANRTVSGKIKVLTTEFVSTSFENTYYSEFTSNTYLDWGVTDYVSYFDTGYKVHGQGLRFSQANYISVFLNTIDNSSCFMYNRYDWTNSGTSGKWSSIQQVYNAALTLRDVNFRKLKVRGKGKSMQMHFASETGKPFDIIGWSIYETGNTST